MKTNPNHDNDNDHAAPLRKVLREWMVDTTPWPRFQEQVWRRIARAEAQIKPSLRQAFAHWIESMFRRPALAIGYVAILLVLGVATGQHHAQDKSLRAESNWRALYVQSVDPYKATRN